VASSFSSDEQLASKTFNANAVKTPIELAVLDAIPEQRVEEIFRATFSPYTGIVLHKIFFKLKRYTKCFTGASMVTWISQNNKFSVEFSEKLATVFLQRGYISCIASAGKNNDRLINSDKSYYRLTRRKTVCIVGGGFSGVIVANLLKKKFNVIVIDKKPVFEDIMDFPLLVSNPDVYAKITYPYYSVCLILQ